MTQEDKLRFEVGEGFNRLSQEELEETDKFFDELMEQMEEEYGYSGDSPYYDAIGIFMNDQLCRRNQEDFIQVTIYHNDYGTFGWALDQLEDSDLKAYARKVMLDHLKTDDCFDSDEEIEEILEYLELPS